jgi:hypothetical protein
VSRADPRWRVVVTCPDGATIGFPWQTKPERAHSDKRELELYYNKARDMGYRVDVRDSLDRLVTDA